NAVLWRRRWREAKSGGQSDERRLVNDPDEYVFTIDDGDRPPIVIVHQAKGFARWHRLVDDHRSRTEQRSDLRPESFRILPEPADRWDGAVHGRCSSVLNGVAVATRRADGDRYRLTAEPAENALLLGADPVA